MATRMLQYGYIGIQEIKILNSLERISILIELAGT